MKKKLLMCVMALTLAGAQQANAQFFKKLGKVAGAILDAASKESESSNSSKPSKPKKTSTNAAADMINVKVVDAVHYGKKNIRVCFLMTNSGNKTVLARITSVAARFSGNEDTRTTEAIHMSGNGLFYGGDYIDQRIPAGASVKGYAYFDNLEDNVSVMDAAVVNAYYALSNDGGYSFHFDSINEKTEGKSFYGCAVHPLPKSNKERCVCTYPDFELNVKSLYRYGTKVVLTFSLKNGKMPTYFCFDDWKAYDDEGTVYKAPTLGLNMNFGTVKQYNSRMYSSSTVKMQTDAEQEFQLTIDDFSTSSKTIQMIRLPLNVRNFKQGLYNHSTDTEIVFRDLDVKPAPTASSAKSQTSTKPRTRTAARRR